MSDLQKFMVKAFVRKALSAVGGLLLGYGIFTDEEAGGFVDRYLEEAVGAALLAGSSVWTWAYQRYVRAKVVTALELPAGASPAKLEKAMGEKN